MPGTTTVRVLVIDDDPDFVLLIQDLLSDATRSTFIIEDMSTITKGITAVEHGHFDVILLDYKLPDGDSFEFLDRLEKAHIKIPVIIVTSRGDKVLQARALEAGAVEYLAKGTFNTELLERTCIYAIGLQEKRNRNGSGPGVGVLIEQLVDLTRDAIRAQTEATSEIREMRKEVLASQANIQKGIKESLAETEEELKTRRECCTKEHAKVLEEIQSISKFRWALNWIKGNPVAAVTIFLCFLLGVAALVVLIHFVDSSKLKDIKDFVSFILPQDLMGIT